MSLESIRQSVLREAQEEAEGIVRKAQEEAKAMVARAEEEARTRVEEATARERARLEEHVAQTLAGLRRNHRLEILKAKHGQIGVLFAEARKTILSMPDAEYLAMLSEWIGRIDPSMGGQMWTGSIDRDRVDGTFLRRMNRGRPREGRLTRGASDLRIEGGFVLKSERFEVDWSLDGRLQDLQNALTPDLARRLFEEVSDASGA